MTHQPARPPRRTGSPTGPLSPEDLGALGQFVSRDGVWYLEPAPTPASERRAGTHPLA